MSQSIPPSTNSINAVIYLDLPFTRLCVISSDEWQNNCHSSYYSPVLKAPAKALSNIPDGL